MIVMTGRPMNSYCCRNNQAESVITNLLFAFLIIAAAVVVAVAVAVIAGIAITAGLNC